MVCPPQKITLNWGTSGFFTLICIIFITVTVCHAGEGDLATMTVDMTGEDPVYEDARRPLRCHHCYRSVHGEACLILDDFSKLEVQECMQGETCMVERFMTDNELTSFTRKCSRSCTPGCKSAGDTYKLEYCYSCCDNEDFCNTGNTARYNQPSSVLVLTTSALVCLLTIFLKMFV